jgi:hypothetical protein
MREVPAYALEEFLYERTGKIENTGFGIESRFWYAGREIPDQDYWREMPPPLDLSLVERILFSQGIPLTELGIHAYIRDALYRRDRDMTALLNRVVPPSCPMEREEREVIASYAAGVYRQVQEIYSPFTDQTQGPIRQRIAEIHTAVIDLLCRLRKGELDPAWLPRHTFIVLSQIQAHASAMLEDLDMEGETLETELDALDNALDSMLETYEEIQEMIGTALDSYRRSNFTMLRGGIEPGSRCRIVQMSIGGLDVWRRLLIPETSTLETLHRIVQTVFNWKDSSPHHFRISEARKEDGVADLPEEEELCFLIERGSGDLSYEYGEDWVVRIILLSAQETAGKIRCTTGAGAAPPENAGGPVRYKRTLYSLEMGTLAERHRALKELGQGFQPDDFDLDRCNRALDAVFTLRNPPTSGPHRAPP